MKKMLLMILTATLLMSFSLEIRASVIGLEGDRMTWEGVSTPPPGTVSPAFLPNVMAGMAPGLSSVDHRVLVILVEFNDQGAAGSTEADWEDALFGTSGSVQDYYDEVSYGQLLMSPALETFGTPDNGIIGWLALGYDHPNTGSNTGIANQNLTKNALIAADPYIDFASYDTNSSGAVEVSELSVVVIAAGYERSYSSSYTPNVWGHRWSLSFPVAAPLLDGVLVSAGPSGGGYMQYGEWHQSTASNGHMATIGIMAHEMGHDLGLPDLYDVDGGSEGIGKWGLMGSGSWGSAGGWSGSSPSHMCAWSKEFLGYLTPTVVISGTGLSLPDVATNPTVFRVNTVDPDEYFLIENRQPVGFDQGLPIGAGGLLICHIDNLVGSLILNNVNTNETHKRVDVEEAEDGAVGYSEMDDEYNRGDQQDLFYNGNVTQFDDATTPDAMLYGGFYSGIGITNVSAPGNPMTLDLTYTPPVDGDGDGYYLPSDCDDSDPNVHPGAVETAGDGIDSNCNGDDNCFIATAAFGTGMQGKIEILRAFRDRCLMNSEAGEAFVEAYYRFSPPIAEYISSRAWLRSLVSTFLLPVVGFVSLLL